MAHKNEDAASVMAFDALYTTNQIQKLKVLLPYIDPSMQKHMAVYIKYMELQYTMNHVKKHPFQICGFSSSSPRTPDLLKLCQELCHYSSPEEIKQLEQFQNMLQTLETVQEMSQTMAAMQEIFPDMSANGLFGGSSASPDDGENPEASQPSMMDMLMNMLTPEQKTMFEMFQNTSAASEGTEPKTENDNEANYKGDFYDQ
ncbi:MAG: hypothetical protein LUI12_04455 [Clostridiales bacterium]|nr:hypothetical protein [Clostridiales bacterium]